jgi:hypothetical protein
MISIIENLKKKISRPSLNSLIEKETGLVVEGVRSQFLNLGGFHVTQVRKTLPSGRECAGLGVDKNPKLALLKAVSEYFERKAVLTFGHNFKFKSTNGVASHKYSLLAKHAAYFELAERDAFLAHWYSRRPFKKIEVPSKNQSDFQKLIEGKNVKLLFYETTLGFEKATVCFIVDKSSGGFAIGLSAGRGSLDLEKSFQEAIINFELGGYGFSKEDLLKDYDENGLTSLQAHRTYWLYKSILPSWILTGSLDKKLETNFKLQETKYIKLADVPFKVFGAKNEDLLDLPIGVPSENDLTKLTRRIDLNIKNSGEWLIHPIP